MKFRFQMQVVFSQGNKVTSNANISVSVSISVTNIIVHDIYEIGYKCY